MRARSDSPRPAARTTDGCDLCGARRARLVTDVLRSGIKRDVVRCDGCGLVYLFPLFSPEEERRLYEDEYRDRSDVEGHYLPKDARAFFEVELAANAARLDRIHPYLRPDGRGLEIGAAAGSFLWLLRRELVDVRGIELHRAFSAFARTELGLCVYDRPLEEIDFGSLRFQVICLWHTLEHLRSPRSVLQRLWSLLEPGGYVFIELPNVGDALLSLYHPRSFRAFYFQAAHSYYFSAATLCRALRQAGFQPRVQQVQRYGLGNHANWLLRGRPQAKPRYRLPAPLAGLDNAYCRLLRAGARADTLFAIGRRPLQSGPSPDGSPGFIP